MSVLALSLLAISGLVVGILIGTVGIGGVLLVPILTYGFGIQVHAAIAAAMFSYLFSGMAGAVLYARRGSIRWRMAIWLFAGAMPGAFAGAALAAGTPGIGLEFLIALLILFAGFNALRSSGEAAKRRRELAGLPLAAIGAATGFGSAMTGTGGPLILVPILVSLRMQVLTAVGLSQAIQIPVAALATVGNLVYGAVDFVVGTVIAVALVAGVAIGVRFAHAVSGVALRRVLAWVLVLVGMLMAVRAALHGLSLVA